MFLDLSGLYIELRKEVAKKEGRGIFV